MALAEACYALTRAFPREELFGLTSQIRRAASSIPANTAEGHGRDSRDDYVQFLRIAQGSLKEIETHPLLSERVGITSVPTIEPLHAQSDQLGRMVRSLYRALQRH